MTSRILVVDDDTALAEMIGIVLRAEGFDPVFCADGALAVQEWRSQRPDLVLLDLMLPGMDGIEVCRQIRAESGVPVIMLTARGDTADVVHGLEVGADDYIITPFNPKELIARIRTRLRPNPLTSNGVLRVGDLDRSLAFYTDVLGMKLLRRKDYPDGKFTLAFVGYQEESEGAVIELTHNWDTPSYDLGNGYGHIALEVENAYDACARIKEKGGNVVRAAGPMKHGQTVIAFVEDPDGYKIELIQRKDRND